MDQDRSRAPARANRRARRARKLIRVASATAAAALVLVPARRPAIAVDVAWIGPAAGNWNVGANWSGGAVPNNGSPAGTRYNVVIDANALQNTAVIVPANLAFTIDNLALNTADQLDIQNNTFFTLLGNDVNATLGNAGTIRVLSTGNDTRLSLNATGDNHITGGGTIVLDGAARLSSSVGGTITNLDNVIEGDGAVGANQGAFVNQHIIRASSAGQTLTIDPGNTVGGFTNAGSLGAVNGGILVLTGSGLGAFNNTLGVVHAENGSEVRFQDSLSITGGTYTTSGTGVLRVAVNQIANFTNPTFAGNFVAENNTDTNVTGTLVNTGSINLNAGGSATDLQLVGGATVTLSGGGVVNLNSTTAASNANITGAGTLHNVNNTIRGQGGLGANTVAVVNDALVHADVSGRAITLDPSNVGVAAFVNNGTVRVSNGGAIVLTGNGLGGFTNNGLFEALDNSELRLTTSLNVTGSGSFVATAPGSAIRLLVNQAANFTNPHFHGNVILENNTDLNVTGVLTSTGSINVNAGVNTTDIQFNAGGGTLTGGGVVHLNGALAGINGNGTVVNTDHLIRGQGLLGQNAIAIHNRATGLIHADVNGGVLTIDPSNSGTAAFLNDGVVRASNGAAIVLTGSGLGGFTNNNLIEALAGSELRLTTSLGIIGGTLSASGAGALIRNMPGQTTNLNNVTLAGPYVGEIGSQTDVVGTLTDLGSISLNAGTTLTTLRAASGGVVTLAGGGAIHLNGSGAAVTGSGTLLNTDHLIRGQGAIGQNAIAFHNQAAGLIHADVGGGVLTIDPSNSGNAAFLNDGIVRASNGGVVVLTGSGLGGFTNNNLIEALDNSELRLTTSLNLFGGTMRADAPGAAIRNLADQSASFTDLTLVGNYVAENNTDTNFVGTINHTGSISLNSGANATDLVAGSGGVVTLAGAGTVHMNGANARITGSGTFVNTAHVIRGQGAIATNGVAFRNLAAGVIHADVPGGVMTIDPANSGAAAFFNDGIVRASNGAVIVLTGSGLGGFTNNNLFDAQAGSELRLTATATITGGTLSATAAGAAVRVLADQSVTLADLTLAGNVVIENNTDTNVTGVITNLGSINLNAGANPTDLQPSTGAGVTLTGGGGVNLNGANARLVGGGTFVNTNNLIRGRGAIGANGLPFVNGPAGAIHADVPGATLTIDPPNAGVAAFNNNGLLRATNGGHLVLTGSGLGGLTSTGGAIQVHGGSTFTTNVTATMNAGSIELDGTWNVDGATINTGPVAGAGAINHVGGTTTVQHFRVPTLAISGGTLAVAVGGGTAGTSRVQDLSISGPGRLNLTNHDMVIDYTGASPIAAVRGLLRTGYNGGPWSGVGIMTSSGTPSGFAIGYVESTDLFTAFPATFSGQSVDDTSVLLRFTRFGDADVNGTINLNDFNRLAANFGVASGAVWFQGDFNYDGIVNLNDFNLLAANFGLTASGPEVTPQDWANLAAVVPEPTAGVGVIGGAGLLLRRRRSGAR